MITRGKLVSGAAVTLLFFVGLGAGQTSVQEWLTWQGDAARSGWAKDEKAFTKDSVSRMELKWRLQLDTVPSEINYYATLSDPLVAANVPTRQVLRPWSSSPGAQIRFTQSTWTAARSSGNAVFRIL